MVPPYEGGAHSVYETKKTQALQIVTTISHDGKRRLIGIVCYDEMRQKS